MSLPSQGKDVTLGGLIATLKDQPGNCNCNWHLNVSSELISENATHRVERVFRRLVVSIDLPEQVVRLPLPGVK